MFKEPYSLIWDAHGPVALNSERLSWAGVITFFPSGPVAKNPPAKQEP